VGFKPMKCADVRRALKTLGFTMEPQGGTNHEKWRCERDGRLWKVTVSCHRGEVKPLDIKSIITQAGVSKSDWARACE
jgi:predicted RNA binding protein YcfA (HicA-like mRNA interferase family)